MYEASLYRQAAAQKAQDGSSVSKLGPPQNLLQKHAYGCQRDLDLGKEGFRSRLANTPETVLVHSALSELADPEHKIMSLARLNMKKAGKADFRL